MGHDLDDSKRVTQLSREEDVRLGGSGWYTTAATTILLCFLPPSSSLGVLSHAKRLMLETGNTGVTTSPGMLQAAFTPFPACK